MSTDDFTPAHEPFDRTDFIKAGFYTNSEWHQMSTPQAKAMWTKWLAAHDAALLAARPATAIDRETLAPAAERQDIADRLREIANTHDQQAAYMLSYEADFIREVAERISPEVASGVLNGQKESN